MADLTILLLQFTQKVIFQQDGDEEKGSSGDSNSGMDNKNDDTNCNGDDNNGGMDGSRTRTTSQRQKSDLIVMIHSSSTKLPKKGEETGSCSDDETNDNCKRLGEQQQQGEDDEERGATQEEIQQQQPLHLEDPDSEQLEPCSICFEEYNDGEEICWSHNDKCNHFFHKDCIQTWLLTHEECPCCRQNFLPSDENHPENNNNNNRRQFRNASTSRRSSSASSRSSAVLGRSLPRNWVDELADEIQERILQRQRELEYELYRREQQERQRQFMISMGSQLSGEPRQSRSAAQQQQDQDDELLMTRNNAISLEEMATRLLVYRNLTMPFQIRDAVEDDSHAAATAVAAEEDPVRLETPAGLEPWQAYLRPDYQVFSSTPTRTTPTTDNNDTNTSSRIFEMINRRDSALRQETRGQDLQGQDDDEEEFPRSRQPWFRPASREANNGTTGFFRHRFPATIRTAAERVAPAAPSSEVASTSVSSNSPARHSAHHQSPEPNTPSQPIAVTSSTEESNGNNLVEGEEVDA